MGKINLSIGMQNISKEVSSTTCNCLGDTLIFECTVMEEFGTVWRGSAINCSNKNELFLQNQRSHKSCSNGTITGQIRRVTTGFYTSQLTVIITSDMIGKKIECARDNGSTETVKIENSTVTLNAITSMCSCMSMTL